MNPMGTGIGIKPERIAADMQTPPAAWPKTLARFPTDTL
jgi:hypothetical protein